MPHAQSAARGASPRDSPVFKFNKQAPILPHTIFWSGRMSHALTVFQSGLTTAQSLISAVLNSRGQKNNAQASELQTSKPPEQTVGRKPNTHRLDLGVVGVELDNTGAVKVDEYSRSTVPNIWAVGDVTNRINLTPVALMEGTCFAKTVFGGQPTKPDYNHVPCAVFCMPPLSVVGLSEQQAIEQAKSDVSVFTSTFTPMRNTISGRQEKTVMKLVVDSETDKVLGASMCGPDAPEIMQGIAVALKSGATKAQFDSTVGIHPTAAEEFVTMRTVTRRIAAGSKVKKSE